MNYFQSLLIYITLLSAITKQSASAFTVQTSPRSLSPSLLLVSPVTSAGAPKKQNSSLNMAGFGGGGSGSGSSSSKGGKKGKNKKSTAAPPLVLKPKQQWDRYGDLKAFNAVKVAVRVVKDKNNGDGENDLNQWLEAGKVKSENDEAVDIAVALQRGLIAEHSKRLYPLQVLPKDRVEWAYSTNLSPEQGDWITINKDIAQDAPSGMEKRIGFEGKPDPASGFYCHYENGRLVDKYSGDVVSKE